ncbi:helix-turn-helix domain-containing protein [Pelosinus propionicus]|uniref:Helix-turn-helix n=1 Tax=Pelosinus propionicus DSM 13327 TaxID=1123291 RepID=A0A1I4PT74_9FIRM|nr:helix-turn-helix transcriptional regulator [Pelosinus propionicus]SFM31051.1 Helix-turn-helix [Pelosinus propionicus DSM 13327]
MNWKEAKKIIASDPEVAQALKENEVEYKIIMQVLNARLEKKMTQKDLAVLANTQQANIARLESGKSNPSVNFLSKVAKGLGKKLEIRFV